MLHRFFPFSFPFLRIEIPLRFSSSRIGNHLNPRSISLDRIENKILLFIYLFIYFSFSLFTQHPMILNGKNFDNHENYLSSCSSLKKKKILAYNKRFLSLYPGRVTRYKICQKGQKREKEEREGGLSQHPVVCYFWPGNCGEVTSACSRFQNRGTKGRHENMTLVGAALLLAKLLMLHASLSPSPPSPPCSPVCLPRLLLPEQLLAARLV